MSTEGGNGGGGNGNPEEGSTGSTGNSSSEVVKFRSDYSIHIVNRDFSVPRRRGIGGAHNLNEFNKYLNEVNIVSRTNHPSVPGIQKISYQIRALDKAGNPTGAFKAQILEKTVYDPAVISDQQILQWGREAATEVQAAGRLTREWYGYAKNGVKFRGYLDDTGAVRSFFPEF